MYHVNYKHYHSKANNGFTGESATKYCDNGSENLMQVTDFFLREKALVQLLEKEVIFALVNT